jgi:hypothetical protein
VARYQETARDLGHDDHLALGEQLWSAVKNLNKVEAELARVGNLGGDEVHRRLHANLDGHEVNCRFAHAVKLGALFA